MGCGAETVPQPARRFPARTAKFVAAAVLGDYVSNNFARTALYDKQKPCSIPSPLLR